VWSVFEQTSAMRTVGVEEELLLFDMHTGKPRSVAGQVIAATGGDSRRGAGEGRVEAELQRATWWKPNLPWPASLPTLKNSCVTRDIWRPVPPRKRRDTLVVADLPTLGQRPGPNDRFC